MNKQKDNQARKLRPDNWLMQGASCNSCLCQKHLYSFIAPEQLLQRKNILERDLQISKINNRNNLCCGQ